MIVESATTVGSSATEIESGFVVFVVVFVVFVVQLVNIDTDVAKMMAVFILFIFYL